MKEEIQIRKGTRTDLPAVLALIKELALYEKAPEEVTNTLADMERDGFGEKPVYDLLVAVADELVIGIAVYFTKYSTWKGKGIYLDDIVIKEEFRNKGIGRKLFNALIGEAKKINAKQLHWQVLDWNEPAIGFYKTYPSSFDATWINCKMNEKDINNFIP